MREHSEPVQGESLEPDLTAVRQLLHDAGAVSVPPGHLDLAQVVRGGRRRVRRRRAQQALAGVAVAALAIGLIATTGGNMRSAPAPAAPTPSSRASSPSPQESVADEPLAVVLADPASVLSQVVFSDPRHASADLSLCTSSCTSFVLVTSDAWHSWHAMPSPPGGGRLLPLADGSVLVASSDGSDGTVLTVLHPDGSAAPVHESPSSVAYAPGMQLVPRTLFEPKAASTDAAYWAYDEASETVRPVHLSAPGYPYLPPVAAPDGAVVMLTRQTAAATSPLLVARSTDSGRTWTSRRLVPTTPGVPYAAVGPGGRLAVAFGPVADDVNPFRELRTSGDGGRTWSVIPPTGGRPATVSGLAWTSDGSLLLAEDMPGGLWVSRLGGPLHRAKGAPAAAQSALGTTAGVVTSQNTPRTVWWTQDGTTWADWSLPTSVPDLDLVLVPNPSTHVPGS